MRPASPQTRPAARRSVAVPARHRGSWARRRPSPLPDLAADDRADYVSAPGTSPAAASSTGAGPRKVSTSAPTSPSVDSDPARLETLVGQLAAVLDVPTADLDAQDPDSLRLRVRLLRRVEGMTSAAMAATVGALSRNGGIAQDGASSTTAWVAQQTGRSRRESSRTSRLASSLPDLPATSQALAGGELNVESADTIAQAARDARLGSPDEVEAQLLPLAHEGPERLRAHVRRLTQQADGAAMLRDETRQRARRRVSLTQRDDGMWDLYGQLTAEVGDRFRTLLDAVDEADPVETPDDRRRRPEQRMADALARVVDMALDLGPLPAVAGVARPHISVLVDVATFDADLTDPDDPDRPVRPDDAAWAQLPGAETAWAGTLSPQTARKLCCDAGVSRVVMAGASQVLDVGRETRDWSPSQRRAVNARDRSCRGPGCGRPIGWTQIHHVRWWRRGGPTAVDNGLALCSGCHDLVHHRGWHVELDPATAAATWTSPDDRQTIVTHPRPPT